VIVRDRLGHARDRHRLQPFQTAELGIGCTQAVEHHRPHHRLGIECAARGAQGLTYGIAQTQTRPQFIQGMHIAQRPCRVVLRHGCRDRHATERTLQAVDEWIEFLAVQLIQATEVGDHALAHPGLGAEAFDELQVAPAAGAGDARVHVSTLSHANPPLKPSKR
jgi:hypothetical protein